MSGPDQDPKKHNKNLQSDPDQETVLDKASNSDGKYDTTIHTQPLNDDAAFSHIDPDAVTKISDRINHGTRSTFVQDGQNTPITSRSTTQELELAKLPVLPGYRYLSFIGRGGMGVVIKAEDTKLNRKVALKLPLPQYLDDHQFRERFLREARSVASLRHPNICPIYDFGEHGEQLYLVMPFIQGQTLDDWLDENPTNARKKAEVLAAVADAVSAAHQAQIIHRDLKPSNIIIEEKNQMPLLMDFGLAKQISDENASLLTQDGQIVGTPAYMSPEQARGSKDVHAAADIYSLGAILYEMLTDKQPYTGGMRQILLELDAGPPIPPKKINPKINSDLETICLKAIQRLPKDRYVSAQDMAKDLRRFAGGESILARRLGIDKRFFNFVNRHRLSLAISCILVVVLLSSGIYLLMTAGRLGQIADVQKRIDAIDSTELLKADVRDEFQLNIQKLSEVDVEAAKQAQERYQSALQKAFTDQLGQSRIDEELNKNLKELISDIQSSDFKRGQELKNALDERLSHWQDVGSLQSSHPNWVQLEDKLISMQLSGPVPTGLMSSRPCDIKAQWAAWNHAEPVSLGIYVSGHPIYEVKISQTEEVVKSSTEWELVLYRNDRPLMFWPIPKPSSSPSIQLRIIRGDLRITYNKKEYTHRDIFPLQYATAEVHLQQPTNTLVQFVKLRERSSALNPSALELGDQLYAQKKWQEAEQAYASHELKAENDSLRFESIYKKSMCQLKQGHRAVAQESLSLILQSNDETWSSLAGCQLWASLLESGNVDEAEAVATLLDLQFDRAVITANLPHDLRTKIRRHYLNTAGGKGILLPDKNRLTGLHNLIKVNEIITTNPRIIGLSHYMYIRALHWERKFTEALEASQKYLNKYGDAESRWSAHVLADFAWILRRNGEAERAIALMDNYTIRCQRDRHYLVIFAPEYARCLIAIGKQDKALTYLENIEQEQLSLNSYHIWADLYCMKSVLTTDPTLKLHYQKMSTVKSWKQSYPAKGHGLSGFATNYSLLSTQYEDDPKQAQDTLDQFAKQHFGQHGDGNSFSGLLRNLNIGPAVLKKMWVTKRGRTVSQDFILRRHDFRGTVRDLICLFAYTEASSRCFPKGANVLQDQFLWDTTTNSFEAFQDSKLEMRTMVGLAIAYKGISGQLGWGFASKELHEDIRGEISYLMHLRYLQLGKNKVAAGMLNEAKQYVKPNTSLARLLAAESNKGVAPAATTEATSP